LSGLQSGQTMRGLSTDSDSVRDFQTFAKRTGNERVELQTEGSEFVHQMRRR